MKTIKNQYGKEFDNDAVVDMMDDELREELHMDIAPCTDQEFYEEYCKKNCNYACMHGEDYKKIS